ncbi:hypothetical protein CCACVL1_25628, partial [Corchorus capsularis]
LNLTDFIITTIYYKQPTLSVILCSIRETNLTKFPAMEDMGAISEVTVSIFFFFSRVKEHNLEDKNQN